MQGPPRRYQKERMSIADRKHEMGPNSNTPQQTDGVGKEFKHRSIMHNFKIRGGASLADTSEVTSVSTALAGKQLKNRFRLSTTPHSDVESKRKKRTGVTEQNPQKIPLSQSARTVSGPTGTNKERGNLMGPSKKTHKHQLTDQVSEKKNAKSKDQRILLKISPSTHRLDPFDVLPVPGTAQLDNLFKLYKTGSRVNSIAINAKLTWWSFISNDAGLLHATLATWALYGILAQGLNCLTVQKLKHKSEAIKEVNMKICAPDTRISDETVGTVLTLASFENLIGAYDAAKLHVTALKSMVIARGGLYAFGHNDGLIRGITWVDFHTAAAFHTPPSYPRIQLDPDTPPLPDTLLESAASTSPTSLLQLSLAAVDCFNIFYRLHRLALAVSSPWTGRVDRLTLSNLLYESEYLILSVPNYIQEYNASATQGGEESDEIYQVRRKMAGPASVVEAILAATQIFTYAALREIPTNTRIFSILLDRLRVSLARSSPSTIALWKAEKNLGVLLWTLVVACAVIFSESGRMWWIKHLVDVMAELEIASRFDLEIALKHVAWVDTYFNRILSGIWDEIVRVRKERKSEHETR